MGASVLTVSILNFYFYFGNIATESYERMCDSVFEMNWQKLPLRLQKYVVIMIANMQKPLYYHGFQIVNLEFVTFAGVSLNKTSLCILKIKIILKTIICSSFSDQSLPIFWPSKLSHPKDEMIILHT